MILVIAEKPSVARTIASVLDAKSCGDGYINNDTYLISWCLGHLVELAPPDVYGERYAQKPWTLENIPIIPNDWIFRENESTKKQLSVLKKLMRRSDVSEIVCATDAGREGEGIFRYVYRYVGCNKPVKRLWTSSLEESAIRKGFEELKDDSEYDNLYKACFARAKADWLIGMNATRLFSVKYHAPLSVGRVRTPTLAMIVERNNKIKNFVKETYYTVDVSCDGFIASSPRIDDNAAADSLRSTVDGQRLAVSTVKKQTKRENPPKLYDLTTLQREANRYYGYTAQQTLDCVQSLYEQKLCTYPRTDSQYITDDMADTASSLVSTVSSIFPEFAVDIAPDINRIINNKKVSDHHALLPTAEIGKCRVNELPTSELNILKLISLRLMCAVHQAHTYEAAVIELVPQNKEIDVTFKATGKTVIENGWKQLSAKCAKKDGSAAQSQNLPDLEENQVLECIGAAVSTHFTTPPSQFTEDTLLSAMETAGNSDYNESSDVEKKGLGTPATRAATIEELVKKEFIKREKKNLLPTEKGEKLILCVPDEIKSAKMTAEWETALQQIEKGKASDTEFLNSIESYVRSIVEKYAEAPVSSNIFSNRRSIGICPLCGGKVIEYPKSYTCENGGRDGTCALTVWKTTLGKEIPKEQAVKLITDGRTDLIKGLKSKAGKQFDAYFKLNSNGEIEFEFPQQKQRYKNDRRRNYKK